MPKKRDLIKAKREEKVGYLQVGSSSGLHILNKLVPVITPYQIKLLTVLLGFSHP
jgi:hypothetical protein